jgi:hypothetical protein
MKYLLMIIMFCGLIGGLIVDAKVYAKPLTLEESTKSSCKINAYGIINKKIGSGTVIDFKNGKYYILTNGHVVNGSMRVTLQFANDGYSSNEVPAKLVWEYYVPDTSMDAALIEIDNKVLNGYKPVVIPLAPRGTIIKEGMYLQGSGYPSGRWNQAWQARVIRARSNIISFNMPPENGQSGTSFTSVINDDTYVFGLVTWRIGNSLDDFGAGLSIDRLYQMIDGNAKSDRIEANYFVPTAKYPDCIGCKRPHAEHILHQDGLRKCPTCKKHNKTFAKHSEEELTTHKCFPLVPNPFGRPWGPGIRIPDNRNNDPHNSPNNPTRPDGPKGIWPNLDNPSVPDKPAEDKGVKLKELEAKIKDLQGKLDRVSSENSGLVGQVKVWKDKLEALQKVKDGLTKDNEAIKNNHNKLADDYGKLDTDHKSALDKIIDKEKTIFGLKNNTNHWLDSTAKQYGTTGNTVENTSLAIGTLLLGSFIGPWLTRKVGPIGARIVIWAAKKAGHRVVEKITEKKTNKVENTAHEGYNNIEDKKPNITPVAKEESYVEVNQRGKDFFALKKHDGENTKGWALRGLLYKEAVGYLRQGRLEYRPGVILQGQEKTAHAIDNWVKINFIKRMNDEKLQNMTEDEALMNATIGYLYQEAVVRVRTGQFGNILNPREIADAIDDWVNTELMKFIEGKITGEKE